MYQGLIGDTPGVGIRPRNSDAFIDSQMFQLQSGDQNLVPSNPEGEGKTNADYAARVHRFFEKYQKKPAQPLWPPGKEDLTQDDYDERYRLRGYKVRGNWKSAKHQKAWGAIPKNIWYVWENSERSQTVFWGIASLLWVLHFLGKKALEPVYT